LIQEWKDYQAFCSLGAKAMLQHFEVDERAICSFKYALLASSIVIAIVVS
jgi:hypothetical protein